MEDIINLSPILRTQVNREVTLINYLQEYMEGEYENSISMEESFTIPVNLKDKYSFPCMPSLQFTSLKNLDAKLYGKDKKSCPFKIEHQNPEFKSITFMLNYKSNFRNFNAKAVQVFLLFNIILDLSFFR